MITKLSELPFHFLSLEKKLLAVEQIFYIYFCEDCTWVEHYYVVLEVM